MSVGFSQTTYDVIELPEDIPEEIPFVIDDCSLAFHLGFRNKVLWYLLNDIPKQYTVHKIPKKRGGFRIIHDPSDILKLMQQQFHIKFLAPLQEQLGPHVTAYRPGKSVIDAAKQHIPPCPTCDSNPPGISPKKHDCPRRGTFIQMDLQDFFPRTSISQVRNFFKRQGYSHYVSSLMASLLTVRYIPNPKYGTKKGQHGTKVPEFFAGVPQGAPTSGAICNLVANDLLDKNILAYMKQLDNLFGLKDTRRFVYSRYSDDLTISCGLELNYESKKGIVNQITKIAQDAGYRINKKKTSITPGHYRRVLLGVVCNQKPNYSKDNYYRMRAIIHNCAVHGFESQLERSKQESVDSMVAWLRGNVNWAVQINEQKGSKLQGELLMAMEKNGLTERTIGD